jgi:hypothetical protein
MSTQRIIGNAFFLGALSLLVLALTPVPAPAGSIVQNTKPQQTLILKKTPTPPPTVVPQAVTPPALAPQAVHPFKNPVAGQAEKGMNLVSPLPSSIKAGHSKEQKIKPPAMLIPSDVFFDVTTEIPGPPPKPALAPQEGVSPTGSGIGDPGAPDISKPEAPDFQPYKGPAAGRAEKGMSVVSPLGKGSSDE